MAAHQKAVVADAAQHVEHLQGGDGHLVAHGDAGDAELAPVGHGVQLPGLFAGHLEAGGPAQAVFAQVAVQALGPEHDRDLRGADVAGLAQDAGHVQDAVRVEVPQWPPGVEPHAVLAVELVVGGDQAFVERRGDDPDLEDGAGLVVHAHGAVQARAGGGFVVAVQVVGGPRRHGEDGPGAHLLHDGPGGLRMEIGHGRIQGALDEVLDVLVEGQVDVGALLRLDFQRAARVDFAALAVALALAQAGPALQEGIPALFEPGAADAFLVREAQQVAGQRIVRIVARGQRLEEHAGQLEALDLHGHLFAHQARHGLVAAARPVDAVEHLRRRQVQHPGQLRAHRARLAVAQHHGRIHADVFDRQIQRQQLAVAVQDAAAPDQDAFLHVAHAAHARLEGFVRPQVQHAQADHQDPPARQQRHGDGGRPPDVAAVSHAAPRRRGPRTGRVRPARPRAAG